MSRRIVNVGTRGSKLALWQANWVLGRLAAARPEIDFTVKIVKTSGDVQKDASLSVIGGQGVFTKELESALLREEIDLAVHSLKDLPTIIPGELQLGAIAEREDPRDALVNRIDRPAPGDSLLDLEPGAVVGTSSPRRVAQLRALRPDLRIEDMRGNVDTRLGKLDAGNYDYIVLACAGLRRLGWADRIGFPIAASEMLPAVGQGALGIEIRTGDAAIAELVQALDHRPTRLACLAERAFLRTAGGGCQLPLTAHAQVVDENISIDGLMIDEPTGAVLRNSNGGAAIEAEELGNALAVAMLKDLSGSPLPANGTSA
jgi:hydroxymethylbilane synthase